jgi:hypothetical protein
LQRVFVRNIVHVVYPLSLAIKLGYYTTQNIDQPNLLPWVIGRCSRGSRTSGQCIDVKLTPGQRFDNTSFMNNSESFKTLQYRSEQIQKGALKPKKKNFTNRDPLHHIGAVRINAIYDIATVNECLKMSKTDACIFKWPTATSHDIFDVNERDFVFCHIVSGKSSSLQSLQAGSDKEPHVLSALNGDSLGESQVRQTMADVPEMEYFIACIIMYANENPEAIAFCASLVKKILLSCYVYTNGTTFMGVAMQNVAYDNIGKTISGRFAVNMRAGEATITGSLPHIHTGETVVVQLPEAEKMSQDCTTQCILLLKSVTNVSEDGVTYDATITKLVDEINKQQEANNMNNISNKYTLQVMTVTQAIEFNYFIDTWNEHYQNIRSMYFIQEPKRMKKMFSLFLTRL